MAKLAKNSLNTTKDKFEWFNGILDYLRDKHLKDIIIQYLTQKRHL